MSDSQREPKLLRASKNHSRDWGRLNWDIGVNSDLLVVSKSGRTVTWQPSQIGPDGKNNNPCWVPVRTGANLYNGRFCFDFIVDEMASRQIGVGFMLLWNVGPDWGFFGYLGASSTAWAYDPSTGDVVTRTKSIQGNLPVFANGRSGVVSLELNLPVDAEGYAVFEVEGVKSNAIKLPVGAVILPAACLLAESQQVTLGPLKFENIA